MKASESGFRGFFIVKDKKGRIKKDNWDNLTPEQQELIKQEEQRNGGTSQSSRT